MLGGRPNEGDQPEGFPRRHPHTLGEWNDNNTIYLGSGTTAKRAHESLRLSKPGHGVSCWHIPSWLRSTGLSYHNEPARWTGENELRVVGRGQEFIADTVDLVEPKLWLAAIIEAIRH